MLPVPIPQLAPISGVHRIVETCPVSGCEELRAEGVLCVTHLEEFRERTLKRRELR